MTDQGSRPGKIEYRVELIVENYQRTSVSQSKLGTSIFRYNKEKSDEKIENEK